jgi:probable HAF family extracellular repeat protein
MPSISRHVRTTFALPFLLWAGALSAQSNRLNGDVTNDGAVTAADAQAVLQAVVGLTLPAALNASYGDANCDGVVGAVDAQIILMSAVQMAVAQFCVTKPSDPETFTVVPASTTVATFQFTTAVVRGIKLTNPTYNGSIGTTTFVAEPINDSTLAFVVPVVVAGDHQLRISTAKSTGTAGLTVTVTPVVTNPVAFMTSFISSFQTELSATDLTITDAASSGLPVNETGLRNDIAKGRAEAQSATSEFSALSPADQQEVANILQATYGSTLFAPASAAAMSNSVDDFNTCLNGPDPHYMSGCSPITAKREFDWKEYATKCEKKMAAAKGIRATLRKAIIHTVTLCHAARLSKWTGETWAALEIPKISDFDPFALLDKVLAPGSAAVPFAAAPATYSGTALVFTNGVAKALYPTVKFRPMVGGDTVTLSAVAGIALLLETATRDWKTLDSLAGLPVSTAPPTLDMIQSASAKADSYPLTNLRLGAIAPSSVTGTSAIVGSEWRLTFSASGSFDTPFTFDIIFDGGSFGVDTMRVAGLVTTGPTDLGTLGGTRASAQAINEAGQVVGASDLADGRSHAFLWENGVMRDLGTLGGRNSRAQGINEKGQIVGTSETADFKSRAFLWENGVMRDLGTLGGNNSSASAINDAGLIVGYTDIATQGGEWGFIITGGVMRRIALGGRDTLGSHPRAINNAGDIVGDYYNAQGQTVTFMLDSTGFRSLGSFTPVDINDSKQVVGIGRVNATTTAVQVWQNGSAVSLGGASHSAGAINNAGVVVGGLLISGNQRGFAWQGGALHELRTLGGQNSHAADINEKGRIVGHAQKADGSYRAVIW